MPSIGAENRSKSEAKIWNCTKYFVLLHCQSEIKASALLRLKIGIKREAAARCSQSQIKSNTMKDAIKREQSDARISSAEREHLRW
jgi:hypothetical protein